MSAPAARMPRRPRWPLIVGAVLLVAVVAGVIALSLGKGRGVRVGDRLDAQTVFSGQTTDHKMSVPVAFGTLSVTVGTGTEIGERGNRKRAPDGATIVEVSWASAYDQPGPVWPGADAIERKDPGARLTLVTGGHRYPIANAVTIADEGASAIVVVQGDASDARVESRVSGRTFRSTPGSSTSRVAEGAGYRGCDDAPDKTYVRVTCDLPVDRAVYVAGLGVAPAGKEWLVVSGAAATRQQESVHRYGAGSLRAEYVRSGAPTVTVAVDGVAAKPRVAGPDTVIHASVKLADRAWLVDADRSSTVRLRYHLPTKFDASRSSWPGAPATYEVDVSTTTTYPAS